MGQQTKIPADTEEGGDIGMAGGEYASGADLVGDMAATGRSDPGAANTATRDPYGGSRTEGDGQGQFAMQGQGDLERESDIQGQQNPDFPAQLGMQSMGDPHNARGQGTGSGSSTQGGTSMQQGFSQGKTGADDKQYDLVSVLYHALEGGATYQKYIQDAEQEGDQDLAQFFRDVQQEEQQRAARAQQLLAQRLGGSR
jgi:hypothetical protein